MTRKLFPASPIAIFGFVTAIISGAVTSSLGSIFDVVVNREVIPLPTGVNGLDPESCTWTREGAGILCPFIITTYGQQIGFIKPDGSGFRCLTCSSNLLGRPAYLNALPDQKSVFFGGQSGRFVHNTTFVPQILECAPSLLNCQNITIRNVTVPTTPGMIQAREPRIALDGRHYLWTIVRDDGWLLVLGDLARTEDTYTVTNARVLNPSSSNPPSTASDWAIRLSWTEGKSFYKGNTVIFASTRDSAGNFDDYSLNMSTGNVTRVTSNPEWDEDGNIDPSGKYLLVGSSRHLHNQQRTLTSMSLAPFLDAVLIIIWSLATLSSNTVILHDLEKWLLTLDDDNTASDSGVLINCKEGGWTSGSAKNPWHPDGTQAAWGELGPNNTTRLILATFPTLPKQSPLYCEDPNQDTSCQTPTPTWAPLLADYAHLPGGTYTIRGPGGGQATLSIPLGIVLGPANSLRYENYTQAYGTVLNGLSVLAVNATMDTGNMTTAVKLSGRRRGSASYELSIVDSITCGIARSSIDYETLVTHFGEWIPACGFVQPGACADGADADATLFGQGGDFQSSRACLLDEDPRKYLASSTGGMRCYG